MNYQDETAQFLKALQVYHPFDEEEIANQKSMIQFIEAFGSHIWTRDNQVGHVCSSAFVVNKEHTKVLMAYHKIYDSWSWLGGHADGDTDLYQVALKEAREESGILSLKPLHKGFCDAGMMFVKPHMKRGCFIPSHLHLTVAYLLEADESEALQMAPDENEGVEWIDFNQLDSRVSENHMKPIYARLIRKLKAL